MQNTILAEKSTSAQVFVSLLLHPLQVVTSPLQTSMDFRREERVRRIGNARRAGCAKLREPRRRRNAGDVALVLLSIRFVLYSSAPGQQSSRDVGYSIKVGPTGDR